MRRALLLLAAFALTGCEGAPALAEREASFAPYENLTAGGDSLRSFILARTALVLGGLDEEQRPLRRMNGLALLRFGAAAAVASDGYFLTAAHCLRKGEPVWLAAVLERGTPLRWTAVPGRVVWSGDPAVLDLALLKVSANVASFDWADPAAIVPGTPLASAGFGGTEAGVSETWRISLVGGRALEAIPAPTSPSPGGPPVAGIAFSGPIWRGDSGGALATLSGELVGVNDFIVVSAFARKNVALRPDPDWIAKEIERDRLSLKH